MFTLAKLFVPLIAFVGAPVAFSQTAQPAPQIPDLGKVIAQTFSEDDIALITGALRDGLQGKSVDPQRIAPLSQKMEGFALLMFRELLTQSLPMIDGLEGELKRELRRLKEQKQ